MRALFLKEEGLCDACRAKFQRHEKTYCVDGVLYHILFVYNDFLQSLFFQYKEQRDVVLSSVFLQGEEWLKKRLKKYTVCGMCSSDEKRLVRGFEPLKDIFGSLQIFVHSPLYKCKASKQSSRSKAQREKIENEIFLKDIRFPFYRPICLVDDVITTGATLHRGVELLHPECVFVIAAHPLWIEEHKKNRVRSRFFYH